MIQANELRIGNLVLDYNGQITTVTSIVDGAINYSLDWETLWTDEEFYFENLQPIPINEEWLLKFGFAESYKSEFTWKFELEKHPSIEVKMLPNIGFYIKGQCLCLFEYVHTLQNLYFSLTQTELTCK